MPPGWEVEVCVYLQSGQWELSRCHWGGRLRLCVCLQGGRWGSVPASGVGKWGLQVCTCPPLFPRRGICACLHPRHRQWGSVRNCPPPQGLEMGVCVCPPGQLDVPAPTHSSHSSHFIFPPASQCLDGIDYGDFDFTSHMMEQKEPLMETGKGPSGCALPRSWACSGVSHRLSHAS